MKNYHRSPAAEETPLDVLNNTKKSIMLMQTAWLIKMICTISNYATNTMQTSSLSLKRPSIKHLSHHQGPEMMAQVEDLASQFSTAKEQRVVY